MLHIVDAELIEGNYVLYQGELSTVLGPAAQQRCILALPQGNKSQCRPVRARQRGPIIAKNRS
ncbi:hypothetical protein [Pseudomonas sp. L-22-4S-12]|uniref:hypothetical protein n=1 Tax=Pseudomonas sp. L-22-4S-12 TaxID=2610893 RepID=UPI003557C41A